MNFDFRIDLRVLLFTAACVVATLIIFGLAPLGYALRVSLVESISGSRSPGRTPRSFLRYALVIGQVTLGVVLVGGAVVLGRALGDAQAIYPGYDTARPLALVSANSGGYTGPKPEYLLYNEAAARMAAVGGVEAVTSCPPPAPVDSGVGATLR